MGAETYALRMPGAMLERGFWLYVWRIDTPNGEMLYVGRTGDSSSPNAGAPFTRMGQHLGWNNNQNALRRNLVKAGIEPEQCTSFELISHGPIFEEQSDTTSHESPRDMVAALEKRLADNLDAAGYRVLNTVHCRKVLDEARWQEVRKAFVEYFPKMGEN
jgi:hypothetical protein